MTKIFNSKIILAKKILNANKFNQTSSKKNLLKNNLGKILEAKRLVLS